MSMGAGLRIAVLVCGAILLAIDSAAACTCVVVEQPLKDALKTALRDNAHVFLGVAESRAPDDANEDEHDLVYFKVIELFKGEKEERKAIHTGIGSRWVNTCGYHFEIGKTYLVFAYKGKHGLSTGTCTLTTSADRANEILKLLRNESQKTPAKRQEASKQKS